MQGRYQAGGIQSEFEPGSGRRVLRNLLGIRGARAMARVESRALYQATQRLIDETARDHTFTASDICRMHRVWLGEIYSWAGQCRSVNIAKGNFMFAAADRVPALMDRLERECLATLTPCLATDAAEQARRLALVHAELVLIHPFRDGNGRCARLLSTLMGLQAGLPPLEFDGMEGRGKRRYVAAIQAALDQNYEPMEEVFRRLIARTRAADT